MHDGLHGLFHVLPADPFEARVERVLAGKDVGAGQAHESIVALYGAWLAGGRLADLAAQRRSPAAPVMTQQLEALASRAGSSASFLLRGGETTQFCFR